MLGWLFPRPPLDPVEKAWTETHMLWVTEQLGTKTVLTAEGCTTEQFLPEDYAATEDHARTILANMCRPVSLSPDQFQFEVGGGGCQSGGCHSDAADAAASSADTTPTALHIDAGLLANPFGVAAAVAREVAFSQLSQQPGVARDPHLLGWLTDLAAVCMGWGAVIAHASADLAAHGHSCGGGSSTPSTGLPAHMVGYAAALFAYVRDEDRPGWKDAFRLDAMVACDRSLRYLHRTGDTLYTLESAGRPAEPRPTADLLQQLSTGSPSARVAALWDLRDPKHAAAASQTVSRCLSERLAPIREEAAKTIAVYGEADRNTVLALMDLLDDRKSSIRAAAAFALGQVSAGADDVVLHLGPLLHDSDRAVVFAAAKAIESIGESGQEAIPSVLKALRAALIRCDHALIDALTHTLYALDPDPTDRVMEFFEDDYELREQMVHLIVDVLGERDSDSIA